MRLILHKHELPLRHTFTTSHGSRAVIRTLIVELCEGPLSGYGELPQIDYYGGDVDASCRLLERKRAEIEAVGPEPERLIERMPWLRGRPFERCALDVAAWDLWGKLRGRPLHELWGLDIAKAPLSSYTIGLDSIDVMIEKLRERPGFPVYKVKLGGEDDVRIIEELRRHTDAVFRVDANAGWDLDRAVERGRALAALNVELIEQPLPVGQVEAMRRLAAESPLPLVADESCVAEEDVDRCAGLFDGVNIKLTKCGGLTPARRMIERARRLGLSVMLGCMTETTVGISAAAQLLPLADYADLDGALLLGRDPAEGARLGEDGRMTLADAPGTGARLPPEVFAGGLPPLR